MEYDLTQKATRKRLEEFAEELKQISEKVGFKQSARGWAYQLETERLINKDEFDKVESWINKCRKRGILPIDFTSEEEGRKFSGVEKPDEDTPIEDLRYWIENALTTEERYIANWWEGEEYYIQMVVEKIDLKTLFEPVCRKYKIPIATSKGWSSMLQRAVYSKRFKEAEEQGLKPLLLYCRDHDPDGLRISDFLRKNLADLKDIVWENGLTGYDPVNLEIVRFGLNHDFIKKHNLTWINNLITGSKKNLASPSHKNYNMPYVQEYLKEFGARKCEANAIVVIPEVARKFVDKIIKGYLGKDAEERFLAKRQAVRDEVQGFKKKTGLDKSLQKALDLMDKREDDD
ncbi:hypothetical protein LCGC14_3057600, partial [marine sediment metagenome]